MKFAKVSVEVVYEHETLCISEERRNISVDWVFYIVRCPRLPNQV